MGKTGVYLSGGGGNGPFDIGFFRALEEAHIPVDYICGTSVGALVGGAATYLGAYEMFECWKSLTLESVLKIDSSKIRDKKGFIRDLALFKECFLSCYRKDPNRFINIEDIHNLLHSELDGNQIKNSKKGFAVGATEFPGFKNRCIPKEEMGDRVLDYILASIYMPIFSHERRQINGKTYWDLGMFRRYPLEELKKNGCDKFFVVRTEPNILHPMELQMIRAFTKDDDVTFVDFKHRPSVLDFSEEMAKYDLRRGFEETNKVLEKKNSI